MKKEVLSHFDMIHLPITALIIFLVLFMGVLFWVSMKENKKKYSELENLPLDQTDKGSKYV